MKEAFTAMETTFCQIKLETCLHTDKGMFVNAVDIIFCVY